jgi:hypothetical protein
VSHYAKVQDGVVTQVIVAEPEFFDTFVDNSPGKWIKTSYNIRGGVYYDPTTNEPATDQSVINDDDARLRKNYAGVGFTYDRDRDAFIPPKPYDSWVLNEDTCLYEAPVAYPDDGNDYEWDEETTSWVLVEEPTA